MPEPIIPHYEPRTKRPPRAEALRRAATVKVRDPRLPWWRAELRWRIGVRQLYFLLMQLRIYIETGFPITEAWRCAAMSTNYPRLRWLCNKVHSDLKAGTTLAKALQNRRRQLPPFLINMISSSERSGSYGDVLRTLEAHYAWLFSLKGLIIRAVSYLLGNLLLAKVVFIIRDFILAGIDDSGNMDWPETPVATLWMLTLRQFGPVAVSIIVAYGLTLLIHESRRMRVPLDYLVMTMPGLGGLLKRYCIANFCRMYATQTDAGIHPSNVYRDAAASMGNIALERRVLAWQRFVDDGEPVSEALRRAKVLPFETIAMVEVSEHTASTGDVLPRMADFMSDEVRHQMRAFINAMVPLMPFVVAGAFFGAGVFATLGLPVGWFMINFIDIAIFLVFFLIFLI